MEGEEFILFREEALKLVQDALEKIENLRHRYDEKLLYDAYSNIHTVKGEAGFFQLNDVAETLHFAEEDIEKIKVRKDLSDEDFENIKRKLFFVIARIKGAKEGELKSEQDFSEYVLNFFREYTKYLGKKAELKIEVNFPLSREILVYLVHIVTVLLRNAVDHGIEPPDERIRKGKSEVGKVSIVISFLPEENRIHIRCSDDGRGFPPEILAKVRESGVESLKGISSSKVSVHSGRGMGLFSIYNLITSKLPDGKIDIFSERNKGTVIDISFKKY